MTCASAVSPAMTEGIPAMARRADQIIKPRRRRVGTPMGQPVAKTYQWQRLRKQFRAACEQRNAPCWLCGGVIDYGAKRDEPNSFEADHALPSSCYPQQAYNPALLRASHSRCNRARRADEISEGDWVRPDW
jgi:hypothetical protein